MENRNSQSVLITGGLGFTGSNLAIQLVDQGADVRILDIVRSKEKLQSIQQIRDEVQVIDSDIRNDETVENAVKDVDVVYHLASKTSRSAANENPKENLEVNCRGPLNVLESAASCEDSPHVIYASSLAVVGNVSETIDESTMPKPVDIYAILGNAVFLIDGSLSLKYAYSQHPPRSSRRTLRRSQQRRTCLLRSEMTNIFVFKLFQ